jgi:molybdopterin-binding protein
LLDPVFLLEKLGMIPLVRDPRAWLLSAWFGCLDPVTLKSEVAMLSARNQLPATIKSIKLGNVMAEVVMSVGAVEIVAAITRGSAEQLDLKAGDAVKAVIKATEVLIDKS